jgi:hypothetical protein
MNYHGLKLNYYLVEVDVPLSFNKVIVLSTEQYARTDAYTAIQDGMRLGKCATVKSVAPLARKPNAKRLIPITDCYSYTGIGQWAWIYQ